MTLNITAFKMTSLRIMTFSVMTFRITALSITTLDAIAQHESKIIFGSVVLGIVPLS